MRPKVIAELTRSSAWFQPHWLALAVLGSLSSGCVACDDIGCGGGFEWEARTADGSALDPGSYRLEVTLEGTLHAVDCVIEAPPARSTCAEPARVQGEGAFSLSLWPYLPSEGAAPDGFFLRAADRSGSSGDGSYSETRGPESVTVRIVVEGEPLVEASYTLTYQRDRTYRGDERCGFCDSLEQRTFEIPTT